MSTDTQTEKGVQTHRQKREYRHTDRKGSTNRQTERGVQTHRQKKEYRQT